VAGSDAQVRESVVEELAARGMTFVVALGALLHMGGKGASAGK